MVEFLLLASLESDVRLALIMIFFVWAWNFARANFGSGKLALIFAMILIYLTLFKHPELVWILFFTLIGIPFLAKFLDKIVPKPPEPPASKIVLEVKK